MPPLHSPVRRALRPSTPGDFPDAGKVTKGAPKPTVLDSLGAGSPPFSRSLTHRAGLPSATIKDRFATLNWWANRSCFFLWFHQGNTLCFQSVARQGCPRGCLKVSVLATNTARAEGGGIQGGPPPCAGGPGTRRFLVSLCLLSSHKKVGRGMGRSAHTREECRGGCQPSSHWGAQRGEAPSIGSLSPKSP